MLEKPAPSYASGPAETSLRGWTLGEDLDRTVARHGDREALVDCATRRRWTYSELDVDVDETALGLMRLGVDRGDRVVLCVPAGAEHVVALYAVAKAGAVLVVLDPDTGPAELVAAVRRAEARVLVAAPEAAGTDRCAALDAARGALPALRGVVWTGTAAWPELLAAGGRCDHQLLDERMATVSPDDPLLETAESREVRRSHHAVLNGGAAVGEVLGVGARDRLCSTLPGHHWMGLGLAGVAATSYGACVIVPAPVFVPAAALQAVVDERCTSLFGTVDGVIDLLAALGTTGTDVSSLRTGLLAGDPVPAGTMERVVGELRMPEACVGHGSVGTGVLAMTRPDDDLERRTSTVGRVLPYLEVVVADPATGRAVRHGAVGELRARGYAVPPPAADAAGWVRTGDRATMDAGGYVTLVRT